MLRRFGSLLALPCLLMLGTRIPYQALDERSKGDVIGLSGDSGYASTPKLHFELRKDRAPVTPLSQLPGQP